MTSFLLSIGSAACRHLSDIFTAISCGAVDFSGLLDVFCVSESFDDVSEASSLSAALTDCCHALSDSCGKTLFPAEFSFGCCVPQFRSARDFSKDVQTSELISALRGKGLPLSFQTDSEAIEWYFSDLLSSPDNDSVQELFAWFSHIHSETDAGIPVRITLLADLSDSFSSGCTFVLLRELRRRIAERNLFISLIAVAEPHTPVHDLFFRQLRTSFQFLNDRACANTSDKSPSCCADAVWLISLPSSMIDSAEAFRTLSLPAAHILARISSSPELPSAGFHTYETDGTVSLSSLGDQAPSFVAFMRMVVWLLSDIFPSLRSYLSHPARFRSLAPNAKNIIFRQLFSTIKAESSVSDILDMFDTMFRKILSMILRFVRSIPVSLRLTPESVSLWQNAVDACGRFITVASEYDVSVDEAHESGLDAVRPVHRVSLADTDEERLLRRIQDMKQQLDNEERRRDDILSSLGGYRSLQVRMDCLVRCRNALKEAEKKSFSMPETADKFSLLKLERRIRLLHAAVSRCENELVPDIVSKSVSSRPKSSVSETDPYAGTVFIPDTCRLLEQISVSEDRLSGVKMSQLFADIAEPDQKVRMKSLLSACKESTSVFPIQYIITEAYRICKAELSGTRFLSRGIMPTLSLLPDIISVGPILRIQDILELLPKDEENKNTIPDTRGLLAMLLLRQYRRRFSDEAVLQVLELDTGSSPVLDYWLTSRCAKNVHIVSLKNDERSLPYALILPGQSIIPARRTSLHASLVPSFATWFDKEKGLFRDPCEYLSEYDRKILIEMLSSFSESFSDKCNSSLADFVGEFLHDLARERAPYSGDSDLTTRLQAVCGLSSIPAYKESLSVVSCPYEHFLPYDVLGSCLTGQDHFSASTCSDMQEDVLYLYRGVPFARYDSSFLLDSPHAIGEEYTLKKLKDECSLLSDFSDDYRDALIRCLSSLLERFPTVLPEVRDIANSLLTEAMNPVNKKEPSFLWPWDPKSPSMLTILRESLDDTVSSAALQPFSDFLTVFPARGLDVIGDSLLSAMCSMQPHVSEADQAETNVFASDALLPPLSAGFGEILCLTAEGRTLLQPGLLKFERADDDISFRVTLTLDGAFPIHLIRDYSSDEILYLYAHDIPTIALWPSVPFPREDWNAYFVYAHCKEPYSVSVLAEGSSFSELTNTNNDRYVGAFKSCPVCISIARGEHTIGILPNILPHPATVSTDPVDICVDFGSSGTSVVFSTARQCRPMRGPVMVRTLLNNPSSSQDLLRREFLPSVPVSALLPTVTNLFRNVPSSSPIPFLDGIVLMSAGLQDLLSTPSDAVYTSLKWEEEKGRSGFLCLHQILLMAALQARCEGAVSVSWRFCLPDEMAKTGRETLMNLFNTLCKNVYIESGYTIPQDKSPVSFASESSALGSYFRHCCPEDTRGGFMALDIGACTADISLFMRGREQAIRTCQIPLGVHYMLLPSLLRDPDLLLREFSICTDEVFSRDLTLLSEILHAAGTDTISLRKARIALDYFIADHLPLLISSALQLASGGTATRLGSLILLYLSYLMMLSGLVLLQLSNDPSRNDFLPEQMTLCLSGRGSILFEMLPPTVKNTLLHFLSMFRNPRVSTISVMFSSEKKMEIPVGLSLLQDMYSSLPPASAVPSSVAVRPEALLPEFLLRFHARFPFSAELLFPGFFTNDFYHPFTQRGESVITSSIDQSFPDTDSPRPYDSLSAWIGNILDMLS